MADIESNTLKAITSSAKAKWKTEQKKSNAKSSKKNTNKRELTKSKKHNKNKKNGPPKKKRKLNNSKPEQEKKKGRIDFDLPLKEQKKRSVIKLENMPTGLEEKQIEIFFKQFGNVTRYALKRHKYGRSLRYAYIEFDNAEIASIVTDALDTTSMYGQMLTVKEIPPEKVDGKKFFKTNTIENARFNKKFDNDKRNWNNIATIANLEYQFDEWHQKLINDENVINENLKKNGIEYEFHGFEKEIKRQMDKTKEDLETLKQMNEKYGNKVEVEKPIEKVESFLSDSNDSDIDNE